MTLLLLDTTFLIDAARDPKVVDDLIADEDDAAIATITVAELQVGVLLADDRRRPSRAVFVELIRSALPAIDSHNLLDRYDLGVASSHAELLAPARRSRRSRGAHDLIIAATARATGRTGSRPRP